MESMAHRACKRLPNGTSTPNKGRAGLKKERAAVDYAAEGLDGGGIVLAGGVQAEPLHRRRGPARVERAAYQVVEGVGGLDDAAAQWRPGGRPRAWRGGRVPVGRVLGVAVRLVLPADDLGHRAEHLGLLDHVGPELGDALLILPGDQDGGTAGNRVVQRQLADVVHERGVLELEQLGLMNAELAADSDGETAH